MFEKGFLSKAYGSKGKGDSQKETEKGYSGTSKTRDFVKDTYKSPKKAETKFSRSEVGPKYLTDKGSRIPIVDKSPEPLSSSERQALEEELLQEMLKDNSKQISGYDPSYNCYSYVFTDGKAGGWIHTDTMGKILKENGFKEIASASYGNSDYTYTQLPKEGDIVIYRRENNLTIHAGIIIKCDNDPKNIIVRSKMGEMGVFEHPMALSY